MGKVEVSLDEIQKTRDLSIVQWLHGIALPDLLPDTLVTWKGSTLPLPNASSQTWLFFLTRNVS